MKFFKKYFNKHHLTHTPHKWFLAFLISPIHFSEMHYKKKYHLNFNHARKLFAFDMALILSILVLTGATIFWFLYDPTIVDLVNIEITPTTHTEEGVGQRIASGERISYDFIYTNHSDKTALISPSLTLYLPPGLIVEDVEPAESYDTNTHIFTLDDVATNSSGQVSIRGIFFGEPDKELSIGATLSYRQEERDVREQKHASIITTLRGSTLETSVEFPDKILSQGTSDVKITIKNSGSDLLTNITLPFEIDNELRLQASDTEIGEIQTDGWHIDELVSGDEATLEATLIANIAKQTTEKKISLAPIIQILQNNFSQQPAIHNLSIEHPEITLSSSWKDSATTALPGKTQTLRIRLSNTSQTYFENISLSIPTPTSIVDVTRLRQLNNGIYSQGRFVITKNHAANLVKLDPGQSTTLDITIPIRTYPQGGTDPKLSFPVQLSALVSEVEGALYETSTESPTIRIGSNIRLNAESRYYTNEGDQLGRGPIPPQVSKETKYWAMLTLSNGTNQVSNIRLSASLPSGVVWTGRSSVSHGKNVVYNSGTRSISWSQDTLAPHEQAGVYFELSITPNTDQRGASPPLVQNISLSAYDTYTESKINTSARSINTTIPNDSIGKNKGTIVQ